MFRRKPLHSNGEWAFESSMNHLILCFCSVYSLLILLTHVPLHLFPAFFPLPPDQREIWKRMQGIPPYSKAENTTEVWTIHVIFTALMIVCFAHRSVLDPLLCSAGVQGHVCVSRRLKSVRHAVKWRMFVRHACWIWSMVSDDAP